MKVLVNVIFFSFFLFFLCTMSGGLSKFLLSTVSKILPKSVMFKRDVRGLLPELREFKIIAGGLCINIQNFSDKIATVWTFFAKLSQTI